MQQNLIALIKEMLKRFKVMFGSELIYYWHQLMMIY